MVSRNRNTQGGKSIVFDLAPRSPRVNSGQVNSNWVGGIALPTPTFSGYTTGATPGRYKYNITLSNYDATYTYTLSTSAGSATRSGSTITVTGSSDTQSITLYVTASKSGFNDSQQASYTNSTPAAPCAYGTYIEGPVYYPTQNGVPNGCEYNRVCDGNYGIVLYFLSGPCGPSDYCSGCS